MNRYPIWPSFPRIVSLAFATALLIAQANAQGLSHADDGYWTPDAATIATVDAIVLKFVLPKGYDSLDHYSRFYFGTTRNGARIVEGIFVTPQMANWSHKDSTPGVHIVNTLADAPLFADAGCNSVQIEYDVAAGKMLSSTCNTNGPPPPPPH
jgi:hypothetical protein